MTTHTLSRVQRKRFMAGLSVVALVTLAACGGTSGGQQADPTTTTTNPPSPVIRVVPGGDGRMAGSLAESGSPASDMMIWAPTEYVLVGNLPALDGPAAGWWYAPTGELDRVAAARVIEVLGLTGEPAPVPADWGGGWRVGPDDGSAPSLWFGRDGMQSWWYQPAWQNDVRVGMICEYIEEPGMEGPGVEGAIEGPGVESEGMDPSEPTTDSPLQPDAPTPVDPPAPDDPSADPRADPQAGMDVDSAPAPDMMPVENCVDYGPPQNVPNEAEARALATALLERLGITADSYELEVQADGWGSWITGWNLLDGMRSGMAWSLSYGAEAELTYASGFLGVPERTAPFDRVGTAEGFRRLQEGGQEWWWGGAARTLDMVDEPTIDIAEDPADEVLVDPMPVDEYPPMEPLVVEIVDVREEFWMLYDADGAAWLVPAYAFLDAEGGSYLVPAIVDDTVEVVEIDPGDVPVDETTIPEPTDVTEPGEPGGTVDGMGPSDDDAAALVGLPEAEAQEKVEAAGWGFRVVEIDGEGLAITMDYREDRINVAIADGTVVRGYVG